MRIERSRLSISQGNAIQGAMLITGVALLWLGAQRGATILRIASMLIGYGLIYFSAHASAHWFVGRMLGIRFTHYSIGGSTHANAYPPGMRQVFARLPFLAVHTDKESLAHATPIRKSLMFGAGMTSSVLLCTLAAVWCVLMGVPNARALLIANCIWYVGAIIAEARTKGDYAKAAHALTPTLSQRERE